MLRCRMPFQHAYVAARFFAFMRRPFLPPLLAAADVVLGHVDAVFAVTPI